ncbi:6-carboxytetrahydropterin synthase QueD [Enterococcus sp. ALS3]|uniref:6-carboxy-5,6,7,8-tetrahydropterin synthase n=1 Tax=Enterococcus alishanensis TaxID=1303817 RepID=A0ABS6THM9_9ENTE|nr:6-carboxytetrahydropterin synthase QueD [Enterococcus alishanensis]MBV7392476.1 6-carboxytetrahydropterin synthase QueD [Enterococcus alishanensis]
MNISKEFEFDMAHLLDGHDGKCNNLHGHTYKLIVYLEGPLIKEGPKAGMIVDYGDIKKSVKKNVLSKIDHSFIYNLKNKTECEIAKILIKEDKKVYPMEGRTTAENIVKEIFSLLNTNIPELSRIILKESNSSSVEFWGLDYD